MSSHRSSKLPIWVEFKNFFIVSGAIIALIMSFIIYSAYFAPKLELPTIAKITESHPETGKAEHSLIPNTELNNQPLPRSSGPHNPDPLPWRTFSETPVEEDRAVHNLEHGGVVIYFKPDLSADQKSELERLAKTGSYVIAPKENLIKPVVALSWTKSIEFDKVDYSQLQEFYTFWKNKSPERLA